MRESVANLYKGVVHSWLALCGWLTIMLSLCIVALVSYESLHFFKEVNVFDFLFGTDWSPLISPRKYGVLPILWGSFFVALGAIFLSAPLGVGVGMYLSLYSSVRSKRIIKPVVEVLAGIPSVVYGFFAMVIVTPMIQSIFENTKFFNVASAIVVVSIMVLPTIISLSDDAISSIPDAYRDSGLSLGATKSEVAIGILLPAAIPGIVSAVILAFARAIGETMAVTLAAGATPNLTVNPLESIQTMTSFIVQVSFGDAPHGTPEYYSLFAVALLLFLSVFVFNLCSQFIANISTRSYLR